jgi:hypothetical protein
MGCENLLDFDEAVWINEKLGGLKLAYLMGHEGRKAHAAWIASEHWIISART